MKVAFSDEAWDEYLAWRDDDPRILGKINGLIGECRRNPFKGTGKPEPLRGDLQGWWSRRISREHRLVYRVTGKGRDQTLEIIHCRDHY